MSKPYPTFQSPYSLHKPPQTILLHTFFLSVSEFVVKNIRKHLLFSRSFCLKTLPWQKQLIPAPFYLKSISSLLISATLIISQTFHHVCLLLAKKLASQRQAIAFDENFIALLTKSPNTRKFCFFLCFLSFFRLFRFRLLPYWDHYCKFARFDSVTPQKILTNSNNQHPTHATNIWILTNKKY